MFTGGVQVLKMPPLKGVGEGADDPPPQSLGSLREVGFELGGVDAVVEHVCSDAVEFLLVQRTVLGDLLTHVAHLGQLSDELLFLVTHVGMNGQVERHLFDAAQHRRDHRSDHLLDVVARDLAGQLGGHLADDFVTCLLLRSVVPPQLEARFDLAFCRVVQAVELLHALLDGAHHHVGDRVTQLVAEVHECRQDDDDLCQFRHRGIQSR